MPEPDQTPQGIRRKVSRGHRPAADANSGSLALEARVKPEYVPLYPNIDPTLWYQVVQEGEYRDEMEGLWIQVTDRITYVLARHFDLQRQSEVN
ncbi:MAG TPA: hypothetical protein VJ808_11400 [Gemmatimonadales bacterium]|jgi:hypothetical protein|nr:hypothetical protein [Gemmatimonadales bacterium]